MKTVQCTKGFNGFCDQRKHKGCGKECYHAKPPEYYRIKEIP